jgi:hypothetical protein
MLLIRLACCIPDTDDIIQYHTSSGSDLALIRQRCNAHRLGAAARLFLQGFEFSNPASGKCDAWRRRSKMQLLVKFGGPANS